MHFSLREGAPASFAGKRGDCELSRVRAKRKQSSLPLGDKERTGSGGAGERGARRGRGDGARECVCEHGAARSPLQRANRWRDVVGWQDQGGVKLEGAKRYSQVRTTGGWWAVLGEGRA